ncbi:hypothetical protein ETECTG_CDS0003 [Escherichia phage ETEC-TG]|nr:hypothetical protein ETECTG_CDS0003 [Escherichia phage ETEC-TG]
MSRGARHNDNKQQEGRNAGRAKVRISIIHRPPTKNIIHHLELKSWQHCTLWRKQDKSASW